MIGNLTSDRIRFKALVVEDNASFRSVLKDILNRQFPFIHLEEACDGREAMVKIGGCDHVLVFMDIKLPDANGLKLTEHFKRRCPNTKVIILTSYDYPEYRQAAKDSGADHFVSKEEVGNAFFLAAIQSTVDDTAHYS